MSAVFTPSAVERIRVIAEHPADRAELANLMSAVAAADSPADLSDLGAVSVSKIGDSDVFVVGHGHWKALLTIEADKPDRMVIAKIFHVSEEKTEKSEGVVGEASVMK